MPLLRYFLFVGAGLLALIFVIGVAIPTEPVAASLTSQSDAPSIRIKSARILPEKMVFDTNVAMPNRAPVGPVALLPAAAPKVEPAVQATMAPATLASATVAPATLSEMSAKARVREAFAQLPPDQNVFKPKMREAANAVVPDAKVYPARQPVKHKVAARPRPSSQQPEMMVAQQPQQPRFGGFGGFGGLFTW